MLNANASKYSIIEYVAMNWKKNDRHHDYERVFPAINGNSFIISSQVQNTSKKIIRTEYRYRYYCCSAI